MIAEDAAELLLESAGPRARLAASICGLARKPNGISILGVSYGDGDPNIYVTVTDTKAVDAVRCLAPDAIITVID